MEKVKRRQRGRRGREEGEEEKEEGERGREEGGTETVGHTSAKAQGKIRAGNTHLRLIRIQTGFEVMGPDEFPSGYA